MWAIDVVSLSASPQALTKGICRILVLTPPPTLPLFLPLPPSLPPSLPPDLRDTLFYGLLSRSLIFTTRDLALKYRRQCRDRQTVDERGREGGRGGEARGQGACRQE
jgi:hypothetical protein